MGKKEGGPSDRPRSAWYAGWLYRLRLRARAWTFPRSAVPPSAGQRVDVAAASAASVRMGVCTGKAMKVSLDGQGNPRSEELQGDE